MGQVREKENQQQGKNQYAVDAFYDVRSPLFVLPHIYAVIREC